MFANVLLVDEINRATPKTQSALLEAMQERNVTIDGHDPPRCPIPFLILATQNPLEMAGTFPLPEAQLDRFLLKLSVGYPDREAEGELLDANSVDRGDHPARVRCRTPPRSSRCSSSARTSSCPSR